MRDANTGIYIVNPTDRDWTRNRFVVHVGAYGASHFLVWADHLQGAVDETIDYIADHWHLQGLLCDDVVAEKYRDALARGCTEEEAHELAEIDTICGGDCAHYLLAWEVGFTEAPTRDYLKSLAR